MGLIQARVQGGARASCSVGDGSAIWLSAGGLDGHPAARRAWLTLGNFHDWGPAAELPPVGMMRSYRGRVGTYLPGTTSLGFTASQRGRYSAGLCLAWYSQIDWFKKNGDAIDRWQTACPCAQTRIVMTQAGMARVYASGHHLL